MTADLYPLQVLLVTLAGWVNRHQQHDIEYLVEENRVLKNPLLGGSARSQGGPRWVSVVSEAHDQGPQPVPRYLDRLNGRTS